MIRDALAPLADEEDIRVFPPAGAPPPRAMAHLENPPELTPARAALLALMHEFSVRALHAPSLIEVQKLAYFLQRAGEPLGLEFVDHTYGPYADELRRTLSDLEGHFTMGYGDGSQPVPEAEPIEILEGSVPDIKRFIADHSETQRRIDQVLRDISGFESSYGLELLATVHRIMTRDNAAARNEQVTREAISRWSRRKEGLFTDVHVHAAWSSVRGRHLIAATSM